jgi:hypothetical protein
MPRFTVNKSLKKRAGRAPNAASPRSIYTYSGEVDDPLRRSHGSTNAELDARSSFDRSKSVFASLIVTVILAKTGSAIAFLNGKNRNFGFSDADSAHRRALSEASRQTEPYRDHRAHAASRAVLLRNHVRSAYPLESNLTSNMRIGNARSRRF